MEMWQRTMFQGKIFVLAALISFGILYSASRLPAQTLGEQLLAEDPIRLAEQARREGNIVRGAILFHQGNINCAKCHRPTAERERIGPDLSRMDQDVSDQSIIESILQPSAQIKAGYETFVVLTDNGRMVSGIKVMEDDNQLVIRDHSNIDNLIVLERHEIEGIRVGTKSSMPGDLVDQLKNRRQFLDLLRYVLDVKQRGPELMSDSTTTAMRRKLDPALQGLVLIQKYNCIACHVSDSMHPMVEPKQAPRLRWSAKSLNPDYLAAFIVDPQAIKPGSTMPACFPRMDTPSRRQAATAITHFLLSSNQSEYRPPAVDADAARRGFELFHSVGCVACHSPRDQSADEKWLNDSTPLGDLSRKYGTDSLTAFLQDPLAVRPSGHMPSMQLTHREAVDISSFLLQSGPAEVGAWNIDPSLVSQGHSLFRQYNCASCHTDFISQTNAPPASKLKLEELNSLQGCLGNQVGAWPDFKLTPVERDSIWAALQQYPLNLEDHQLIDVTLASLNCIACHDRGDFGGVSAERNHHFQTTNLNLGDQGRIPPTLTGVGAKLNRKWLRDVMVNRRAIRPYMKTRMPQFGEENTQHLFDLFAAVDHVAKMEYPTFDDQKAIRDKGHMLAGDKGLNCVACHTFQYKTSDTMPAVDLTEMTDRLKKDWFYHYMLSPQSFSPNTVMPSFWPGGQAIRKDIPGTALDQIEALWQYLIDGRQARVPSGVVREPLEIVVDNEARMLRRKYPGIGKRGIGVGYPGGVNIVFDAEQLRLGAIWRGKFAEASGVWRGQGSGNVQPLGQPIHFATGPDLDFADRPWIVDDDRPPRHQFKGYVLDASRRPTFIYDLATVRVEDFFSPWIDDNDTMIGLQRMVTLVSQDQHADLRFRLAESPNVAAAGKDVVSVEDKLQISMVSAHSLRFVAVEDGQRVEVPVNIIPGQQQQLVIQYSWK